MTKSKGNASLVIIIVLVVLLMVAVAFGVYFYSKSKFNTEKAKTTSSSPTLTKTLTPTPTTTQATNQAEEAPRQVVENFMKYSIGTIPTATLNFNAARAYLPDDLKAEFSDDASFAARYYGYQEGPSSVEIVSENIKGEDASVKVNALWGDMGQGWVFGLLKTDGKWQIIDFRNDAQ